MLDMHNFNIMIFLEVPHKWHVTWSEEDSSEVFLLCFKCTFFKVSVHNSIEKLLNYFANKCQLAVIRVLVDCLLNIF